MFRDNPRTAYIKGLVNAKTFPVTPLKVVLSQSELQLNIRTLELREIYRREIIKAEVCTATCRKLVPELCLLQYKACAAEDCLLGRCQQQNTVIELLGYPENVFLFVIH